MTPRATATRGGSTRPGWRWPSTTPRAACPASGPDDVYLGNGVSELIVMALQALLDPGDEVLVPSPDYPLWTGAVILCGARAAHYRCDEQHRLAARPGRRGVEDHPGHPGAGDHQPEQSHRGGVLEGDAARPARPGPAARPAGAGRRDLRQDPLRRRGARVGRRARSGPHRADPVGAVQDLPGARLPLWLAGGQRAAPGGGRVPGGPGTAGQHADVPERADPVRHPGRAGRPAEHHRAAAARRQAPGPAGPSPGRG